MAKFEIDTDSGTIKKLEDNSGCGAILIVIVIIALFSGDGSKSTSSVEYWKGDPNCPIFVARDDGSLVAFKKNSAREVDEKFPNGNKVFIFTGCEVNWDDTFQEYGWYILIYNEKSDYYEVVYPNTPNFPDGYRIQIDNDYQRKVCNVMIKAAANHEKFIPKR